MKKIVFKVTDQKITYEKAVYIATDSQNYITAAFEFSEEWAGVTKTAIFKGANGTYSVLLTDNACVIPYEVLTSGFSVSVYGVSGNMRITSDSVYINAVKSGYEDGETPSEPTPTVYEEILDKLSDIKQADSERAEQVKQNADDIDAIQSDMADMNNAVNTKVDKVSGKGLSSNDYTDEEKAKLANLENYTLPDDVVHDSGYVHTDNNYTDEEKEQLKNTPNDILTAVNGIHSTMQSELLGKVDKIDGKGLSENDYTNAEKEKLSGIEANANNYVLPSDAVTSDKLADNAVTSAKIGSKAVLTEKLADKAVTEEKLADYAVSTDKIADKAVTSAKIADNIKAEIAKKADKLKSIPHTALSGNPITITDALADEQPLELRVYGDGIGDLNNGKYEIPIKNSGKNIVDLANMKWKFSNSWNTSYEFNNNTVTIKRTVTSEKSCAVYTDISLQAGTYTVSVSNISINGTFADTAPWVYSPAFSSVYKSAGFKRTFTLNEDKTTQLYLYNAATDGTAGSTATFSVQIEMGSAATDYEPYHEPQTATAILDTPLTGSEYIDFVSKKRNGETDITVNGNITLFDGTNNITCQTEVSPSKLEVSYYQDIKKMELQDLCTISPEAHSRIFRGKNLGTSVTDAQKTAIRDGSFKDLFLGDYWVINNVTWRIVDMDYWYNTGSAAFTTHHLVIMPDTILYTYVINDSATTTGGYVGSKMYTTGLTQAKTTIAAAFPDMVLTHKEYLSNAVTNGVVTGVAEKDSTVELPSEIMIYGTNIFSAINDGTVTFLGHTYCKTQLALFNAAPKFITNRSYWWLRDVASSVYFARIDNNGRAGWGVTLAANGVRPVFAIG